MNGPDLLESIKRLGALANTGLLYANNEYDRERYEELRAMHLDLLHRLSGHSSETLALHLPLAQDYPTAKVDIRGLVLDAEGKLLLVRESADGKWALPGGWADVGSTPAEVVVREIREETGLTAVAQHLLAVFDKRKHPHPPQPFYVYKMVFYCTVLDGALQKGFDVLDVGYFSLDALPELSTDRILESQIRMVYEKVIRSDWQAFFD